MNNLITTSIAIIKTLAIIVISFNTVLFAQTSGSMEGRITDTDGDPLPGANILLTHTIENGDSVKLRSSRGTAADIDGYFSLREIRPATYILKVTYIGYSPRTLEADVNAGDVTELNIELRSVSLRGQQVEVTGQARGQMDAINKQLSSTAMKNVVASDRIREIPDENAVAAISRLPGVSTTRSGGEASDFVIRGLSPKYNTVMINGVEMPSNKGDSRNATVSGVSQYALEGIELFKSITADMDANTVSGALNMQLQEAPDDFQVELLIDRGYNNLNQYWGNYTFNGNISNRFLDGKLGAKLNVTAEKENRSTQSLSAGYGIETTGEGKEQLFLNSINLNDITNFNRRYNGTLVLDYRFSPDSKISISNFYTRRPIDNTSAAKSYSLTSRSLTYSISQNKDGFNDTYLTSVNGQHPLGIFQIDYSVSYSSHNTHNPSSRNWSFSMPGVLESQYASREYRVQHPFDILPHTQDVKDSVSQATLSDLIGPGMSFTKDSLGEQKYQADVNIQMPFNWKSISGFIKTGIAYRTTTRRRDYDGHLQNFNKSAARQYFTSYDWTQVQGNELTMVGFGDRVEGEFLQGNTRFGIYPDMARLNQLYEGWIEYCNEYIAQGESAWRPVFGNPMNLLFRFDQQASVYRDQDATQDYWATYLMSQINIGDDITFTPGVRYERVTADLIGTYYMEKINQPSMLGGGMQPDSINRATRSNEYLLPMVHLKYDPADWWHVKASYTQTLHRPNFNAITPFQYVNNLGSVTRPVYNYGKPHLKPELWNSYDLQLAFYGNRIGMFGINAFYKTVKNLIWNRSWVRVPGDPLLLHWWDDDQTVDVTTWINRDYNVYVRGGEIEWQTSFWYLPNPLNLFTFNVNYTYTHNKTEYPYSKLTQVPYDTTDRGRVLHKTVRIDSTFEGAMIDQPKQIANVSLGFNYRGFTAWLSYRYMGERLTGKNVQDELDSFSSPYQNWDLQLRQQLPIEGLQLLFNLTNINDVLEKSDHRYDSRPTSLANYGWTSNLGIRYRF